MPALAQETEEKDGSASSGSLPTVEVKASAMQATTGMELSMRQTPQSVTVVSKPVLREQGITGMAGAMRSTTGINVLSETGRVRFQSRGFYIDQIQEDGISSTVPGSSGNPTRDPQSMTNLAVYDHIEVLRGPTGLPEPNWDSGANYWMKMAYSDKITSNALMLGTRLNPAERLHVIAGTRYTSWRVSGYEDYQWYIGRVDKDPTAFYSRKRHRFTPYLGVTLGVTFDLDDSSSLYASYTSIFKPNASKDREGRYYNQPIGNVRSRGLDAEISGQIISRWQMAAGYTFNTSQYRRTKSSSRAEGMNCSRHTPRHMLRLYTSYRLPVAGEQWGVGAGLNAQSKTGSLYNMPQGGYAIFNANARYPINPNMELALIVNNLRSYFENNKVRTMGINNFYGQPRTVTLHFLWKM